MNKQETLKAAKKAAGIYAYVRMTEHDGSYIKMVKSRFIMKLDDMYQDDEEFEVSHGIEGEMYIG